nr:RNA pseudouridine synthase [Bacteroidales bacterium]
MDEDTLEIEQQELYEHHRFTVDRGQESLRLDIYLQMRLGGVSRTKIQAAAKAGCIHVNDNVAKPSYKVKPLDVISVLLPEPPHEFELTPEEMDIPVVYED